MSSPSIPQLLIRSEHLRHCAETIAICKRLQLQTLKHYGVDSLPTLNSPQSPQNGCLFTVTDVGTQQIIGSSRLEIASDTYRLPIEQILKQQDGTYPSYFASNKFPTYGEATGCWVNPNYVGLGIPHLLIRLSVLSSIHFKVSKLILFHNPITAKNARSFGFSKINELGNDGTLYYPNERYLSTITQLNIQTLEALPADEKLAIQYLQSKPITQNIEQWKNKKVMVSYDLSGLFVQEQSSEG